MRLIPGNKKKNFVNQNYLTNVSLSIINEIIPVRVATRKEQIEQTATHLFETRGYAATSMRNLAQLLGMEAASIYAHIQSKEEILQKICFRLADEFYNGFRSAVAGTGIIPEQLRAAIRAHVQVITDHLAAAAVFQTEWRHLSEPYLSDIIRRQEEYENNFRQLLQTGQTNGELRVTNVALTARTLLASLNGLPSWYKPEGQLSPEQIADNIADLFLVGLRK